MRDEIQKLKQRRGRTILVEAGGSYLTSAQCSRSSSTGNELEGALKKDLTQRLIVGPDSDTNQSSVQSGTTCLIQNFQKQV